MAAETDRIEQEIAQAREDLANTLDKLAVRANPQRLADDAKAKAFAILRKPAVVYGAAGVGAVVLLLIIRKATR